MHSPYPRLLALSLAMLLPSLGTSIANVALPDIAAAFGASQPDVQWIVIAYLVAVTALIVTAGRLGDLYGRARMLKLGTLLFAFASVGGVWAPSLGALIALRAVQGAGAALMMALTLASVGDLVAKERTGRAMGLLATVSALGTALGPSVGGLLVGRWGWPAVFAAMALAAILAYNALQVFVPPQTRSVARARLDLGGMALLSAALALAAFLVSKGAGLPSGVASGLVLAVLALLGAFVAVERRAVAPLVNLSLLRSPALWPGLVQMALVSMIVMTTLVVGPFYLTGGLGLSAAATGLVMSIGPGVVALSGFPAGQLVDRAGATPVTLAGLGAMVLGSLAMSGLPALLGVGGYAVSLVVLTGGYALFQAANATAVLGRVAATDRGTASGLLALARNAGLIAGASAMGTLYATGVRGVASWGWAGGADTGLAVVFLVATLAAAAALVLAAATRPSARAGHSVLDESGDNTAQSKY